LAERVQTAAGTEKAKRSTSFPMRALSGSLLLALLAVAVAAAVILVALHGWGYYTTPLRVRGYAAPHALLRPSGSLGHVLGVAGVVLMLAMQLYTVRKKRPKGRLPGSLPFWLEFHIFCGLLGPALITFHTSFKFNGVVSVAFWSMVVVVASGFVGRYLYVRIPKTIRGTELTLEELGERSRELRQEVVAYELPEALLRHIEAFEASELPSWARTPTWRGLLFGELSLRLHFAALRRAVRRSEVAPEVLHAALSIVHERALLLRRIAYLRKTRKLFDLWHVLHKPLAYLMLVIVAVHIATAIYFGYAYGR
jgi:hypothetical protein